MLPLAWPINTNPMKVRGPAQLIKDLLIKAILTLYVISVK